jgi:hypothetical protein
MAIRSVKNARSVSHRHGYRAVPVESTVMVLTSSVLLLLKLNGQQLGLAGADVTAGLIRVPPGIDRLQRVQA